MTKASRDTSKRRKREKGKRKREKEKKCERGRERERERGKGEKEKEKDENKCSQLRASVQGHTKERCIPERYIQECPRKAKREEGRVGGGRGLRSRQTRSAATYAVPKWLAALTTIGMSQLGTQ